MADAQACQQFYTLTPLQQSWTDFLLRFRFDWFCTFTFRDSTHPEAALKRFQFLIRKLNDSLYGSHWQRRCTHHGVFWVNGIEYQRRGVIHFHALLGAPENLSEKERRLHWMDFWFQIAGIARIEQISSEVKVSAYCSKYVNKGGEIELSESLKAFCQQRSLVAPAR